MNGVKVHLSEILGRHRISQRQLAQRAGLRTATVSALYNERVKGVEFGTLAAIVNALQELTGQPYTAADLLEVVRTPGKRALPGKAVRQDAETQAWLGDDLSHLGAFEPYEWGEGEQDEGEPISLGFN